MNADLPFGYTVSLGASFAFGMAITWNNGAYHDAAIFCVLLGLVPLLLRYGIAMRRDPKPVDELTTAVCLVFVALVGFVWMAWNDRGLVMYAQKPWTSTKAILGWQFLLLVSYLPFPLVLRRAEPALVSHVRFALFALGVIVCGIETLRVSPTPAIDVWTVQQHGARALLSGQNAYASVIVENTAPGARNALDVPYVYPPMQLYLSALGYAITKDVRATMLVCILGAGAALRFIGWRGGFSGRSEGARLPALLLDAPALFIWCTPKLFFVLEQAWTDPVQVCFVASGLAAVVARRPMLAAVVFGIGVASKQTMFWIVPMACWMLRLPFKAWAILVGTAAASFVPFLGDFARLKYSLVDFQSQLPPRHDGLTFKTYLFRTFQKDFPAPLPAFLMAGVVWAGGMWRLRSSPAHFAATAALLYAVFFAFNKWAFANYYFLIASLSALAAAASLHPRLEAAPAEKSEPLVPPPAAA